MRKRVQNQIMSHEYITNLMIMNPLFKEFASKTFKEHLRNMCLIFHHWIFN